jgi:two-component system, response regulator PdtaR
MQVLVVEDDLMLADCLAEALTDDGHVVCGVAWTVDDAVALARLHRPDVAVLDMQLRGTERGSDVVDQLRESHDLGEMGILYVTGEAERVLLKSGVGHACLSKPYRFSTLDAALEIVRDIAHQGRTTRVLPRGLRLLPQRDAQELPLPAGSHPRHGGIAAASCPAVSCPAVSWPGERARE